MRLKAGEIGWEQEVRGVGELVSACFICLHLRFTAIYDSTVWDFDG